MRSIIICILFAAFALSSYDASAQKSDKTFSFGFGLEAGTITGDFKDVYSAAAGLTFRGSYKAGPGFATLTTGGIVILPKSFEGEDPKAGVLIPIKAGYKYIIGKNFFVMGEIGYSSLKYYYVNEYDEVDSESEGGFTYAPSIGAQFGSFELAVRYESTALPNVNLSGAFLRLGFNF